MKYRIAIMIAAWAVGPHAFAITRATCPAVPNCNAALPACNNVCLYDAATDTWSCDIDVGMGGNPQAAVVADFAIGGSANCNTNRDFAAWGTTRGGTNFFCSFDSTGTNPVVSVELHGTPTADHMCFYKTNWLLENPLDTTDGVSVVYGFMFGEGGNDFLEGSKDDTVDGSGLPTYEETIFGEDGDDDIWLNEGDDFCIAGAGADEVDAGFGADHVSLNNGNDLAWGGDGNDVICGQADTDNIQGNGNDDILDGGGQASDTKNGNLGTNECDAVGSNTSCTPPIASGYSCP